MAGELIPPETSESDVRDEVNRRTHRAGYTDRNGDPTTRGPSVRSRWSRQYHDKFKGVFGHT